MDGVLASVIHIFVGVTTNQILRQCLPVPNLATNVQDVASMGTTKRIVSNLILSVARGSVRCPVPTIITIKVSVCHVNQVCEENVGVLP